MTRPGEDAGWTPTGEQPATSGAAKGCLFRLFALVGAVGVALLCGELLARWLVPRDSVAKWFVVDDRYGFVQKPNFRQRWHYAHTNVTWEARFNSFGHRAPEYPLHLTNATRVLLLGDSFTFGYGLDREHIFAARVEGLLEEQTGREHIVINSGTGGWGTLQEVAYARDHFDVFDPDVVVLTYCDNDVQDDITFRHGMSGGLLPNFPGKRFLRDHLLLYQIVFKQVYDTLYAWKLKWTTRADDASKHVEAGVNPADLNRGQPAREATPDEWERTLNTIRAFHRDYLAHNPNGFLLVQCTHPLRHDIRNRLRRLSDEERLVYVDLYDDLRGLDPDEFLLPYDPHWSKKVHAISARRLAEAILEARGAS